MRVIITGTTRGIGAALLLRMKERGDTVTGTARDGRDGMLRLDVTDPADHQAMAHSIGAEPLDLLVCNAGVYPDKGHDLTTGYGADIWADSFATNVTGTFLAIKALLPNLRKAGGKIAIISSQMASSVQAPGGSYAYRASKAAVLNLGRNLATDLKHDGVAVGIYHPGWVQTDMGGGAASIDTDTSAKGLIARFDALGLATTGCFETWDGRPHDL